MLSKHMYEVFAQFPRSFSSTKSIILKKEELKFCITRVLGRCINEMLFIQSLNLSVVNYQSYERKINLLQFVYVQR